MSRIGKKPITLPSGVTVNIQDGNIVVKGPRGELQQDFRSEVSFTLEGEVLLCKRNSDERQARAYHGLYRSLAANMVEGVTKGFQKSLHIHGVGYRVGKDKINGVNCVVFKKGELGFSHPIYFAIPDELEVTIEERTKIHIKGNDKNMVGLLAAKLRDLKPPDAYKGKGIRYADEVVRLKVGKSGA
jgi:large subunit ribosomal protein L6